MNTDSELLKSLNERQIEAVTCGDRRLLVLAGAGSGKTKTLLQKIEYLVSEKGVSPYSILAITFTKNAANEMIDRLICRADYSGEYESFISDKKVKPSEKDLKRREYIHKFKWINALTMRTFHSFCYSTIKNHGALHFDNKFRIIGDEKASEDNEFSRFTAPETSFEVYHRLLIELCSSNEYLIDLKRYVLDYLVDRIHIPKNAQRMQNNEGLFYRTLKGTMVRSKSEQYIADWLFRHSISYEYEPKINIKDFEFKPDFFIPDANLYLEHVSDLSYPMQGKEEQFQEGQLHFVKTFEYMAKDTAVFNKALDNIVKNRLPANYHKKVALNFNEEFKEYHKNVRTFIEMVMRVMDMLKVDNHYIDDLLPEALADPHERIRNFYQLATPLIHKYADYCKNKSYLDFNDLITESVKMFTNDAEILRKYKDQYQYILVDEFQDVNNLQVDLLQLLLTDDSQLFCVGDDWQSIYGFRGSNVNYIIDFEKHFPGSTLIKLNMNYRSTDNIVGASNEVIKNNKRMIEKEISAFKKSDHKIVVFAGNTEEENVQFCEDAVVALMKEGYSYEDIMFLYSRSKMYQPYFNKFKQKAVKVQAKTIHASKGLEAKAVFILGLTEGYGGFPDVWMNDRIYEIIRKTDYDLLLEEQRRLFYVALTRAKEKLYLITEKGFESSFLKEIPATYTVKTGREYFYREAVEHKCPSCSTALEKLFSFCPHCGAKIT